ncbi:LOW QUALITY PROTEIN: Short-chain dehydrogenase/reductase SDR [Dillenia turbinata]|uniref:Short-chain dehydrogenase/reductase SDR n=1 Tax=Dillenia turbinata TaxID=194707 RepID=A0AAN8Z4A4_9MAGN
MYVRTILRRGFSLHLLRYSMLHPCNHKVLNAASNSIIPKFRFCPFILPEISSVSLSRLLLSLNCDRAIKGIGLVVCGQLVADGVMVVLSARNEKSGLEAPEKLKESEVSDNVIFHQLDVTDPSSWGAICSQWLLLAESKKLWCYIRPKGQISPKQLMKIFIFFDLSLSLQNFQNEWAKWVLRDVEGLTDDRIDKVLHEYLKDFKDCLLEKNGWPKAFSGYIVSEADAYTKLVAKMYPNVCVNCVNPGFIKTDSNGHLGTQSAEQGGECAVRLALPLNGGPSGLFFLQNEANCGQGIDVHNIRNSMFARNKHFLCNLNEVRVFVAKVVTSLTGNTSEFTISDSIALEQANIDNKHRTLQKYHSMKRNFPILLIPSLNKSSSKVDGQPMSLRFALCHCYFHTMDDLVTVVTGVNKGVGLGICKKLAASGISLVLTARDVKRGIEVVDNFGKVNILSVTTQKTSSKEYLTFHVNSLHPGFVQTGLTGSIGHVTSEAGAIGPTKFASRVIVCGHINKFVHKLGADLNLN